jgi:hypothetical protein
LNNLTGSHRTSLWQVGSLDAVDKYVNNNNYYNNETIIIFQAIVTTEPNTTGKRYFKSVMKGTTLI